jgi:hypothetical protein
LGKVRAGDEEDVLMAAASREIRDEILFIYRIASGEMKYIEVNEREVHFRSDPQTGSLIWGEIPGCGESCNADLAQMILEYAMSCEACDDAAITEGLLNVFGKRLSESLAARIQQIAPTETALERAVRALECIHLSMNVPFSVERDNDEIRCRLDLSPLSEAARRTGIGGRLELAYRALYALYQGVAQTVDPGLSIRLPASPHLVDTVLELTLAPATG